MNRCARSGYLVDATHVLPDDATEIFVEGLPVVGCTKLRCRACNALVREVAGLAFKTRDDVAPEEMARLYSLEDLKTSRLLAPTQPDWRLYLCCCSRWLETGAHACAEPDPDELTDPSLPWACDGHPPVVLPHDIDGVRVATLVELRDLAARGLHGFTPPRVRPADAERGAWLARLHARVGSAEAGAIASVALAALDDIAPRTRGMALQFFRTVEHAPAQARVVEILRGHRRGFADVRDEVTAVPNATLEDSAWRVIAPLVAQPGAARELARADVLAGRGRRAVFDALARGDSAWFMEHAEAIARATPASVDDLLASFAQLPSGSPIRALRERIRPPAQAPTAKSMTFDEALAYRGRPVAAWDYASANHSRLNVYAVGSFRAELLASTTIALDEREPTNELLRTRGLRIGGTHADCPFVWVTGDDGLNVWTAETLVTSGKAPAGVARVRTFIGVADAGRRGVAYVLASGDEHVVAELRDDGYKQDPFYDRMDLDDEMAWAFYLGQDLALWLGVPHQDYGGRVVNSDALAIRAVVHELAAEIVKLPATGTFDHVERSLGAFAGTGGMQLRCAPNPLDEQKRFLELKVWTPDRERWRGRWIKQGTTAQIATFLRQPRTAMAVPTTADDLLAKLSSEP